MHGQIAAHNRIRRSNSYMQVSTCSIATAHSNATTGIGHIHLLQLIYLAIQKDIACRIGIYHRSIQHKTTSFFNRPIIGMQIDSSTAQCTRLQFNILSCMNVDAISAIDSIGTIHNNIAQAT